MSTLEQLPAWQALGQHRQEAGDVHMRDLFASDPQRFDRFSLQLGRSCLTIPKTASPNKPWRCCSSWRAR
jgi:glucose-6-phosphate isomerase